MAGTVEGQGSGTAGEEALVRYGTAPGRWVLAAMILGSGLAFLDSTVVNVALPAIGADLGADVAGLQWILTGYLLSLSSLILLGGSLGDRFGRRRVFLVGVVWFAVASLLCGLAPTIPLLVAARVLQGIGGALLTPGSLAIIEASFRPEDRGRAIGAWSGLGGIATAIGPFLGGYLVDAVSWRWVFLINLPFAVAVVLIALLRVPESFDATMTGKVDVLGAVTGSLGLGGLTYALIEAGERGPSPLVLTVGAVGLAALATFLLAERRSRSPMLPLGIFSSAQFTWANVVTFAVYAALGGVLFLFVVHLQQVMGYSALQAGSAALPVTLLMLLLSARAGELSQRIGPRLPMALGPVVAGAGVALMGRIVPGTTYLSAVFPAVVVFGLGLSLTVAPLTTTVLAAADDRHAGVASGVNNAVARVAQLLAVAVIPVAVGLTGDAYENAEVFAAGFQRATLLSAGLLVVGGVLAWLTIDPGLHDRAARVTAPAERPAPTRPHAHCGVQGPPLRSGRA